MLFTSYKKKVLQVTVGLATLVGCSGPPDTGELVPVEKIPELILKVAKNHLPGTQFDTAFKMKTDGKRSYEIKGRDKEGNFREVEVSDTGEIIDIE